MIFIQLTTTITAATSVCPSVRPSVRLHRVIPTKMKVIPILVVINVGNLKGNNKKKEDSVSAVRKLLVFEVFLRWTGEELQSQVFIVPWVGYWRCIHGEAYQ